MSRRHPSGMLRLERGLATVEMAITLPLLLLLLFVTAEFGHLLSEYDTLDKAVRDGARYAASVSAQGSTGFVLITSSIQSAVGNLVAYGNVGGTGAPLLPSLSPSDVSVTATGNDLYVEVSVTYTYAPWLGNALQTFGLGPAVQLNIPLTTSCVMRAL